VDFKDKLRSLQFRTGPAGPKRTVDVHDKHKVVVTERTDAEGDHQDVHVIAPPPARFPKKETDQ
jgi:hypothetical protein